MLHLACEDREHADAGKLVKTMQMTLVSSCLYSANGRALMILFQSRLTAVKTAKRVVSVSFTGILPLCETPEGLHRLENAPLT